MVEGMSSACDDTESWLSSLMSGQTVLGARCADCSSIMNSTTVSAQISEYGLVSLSRTPYLSASGTSNRTINDTRSTVH